MPLLHTSHPFSATTFGIWQAAEGEAFFREELPFSKEEEEEFSKLKNAIRRLEWLAGRWLLHKLTGAPQRLPLSKDAFSKPFFPKNQHLACSLSHSHGIVGALIADFGLQMEEIGDYRIAQEFAAPQYPTPHSQIGCDIQVLVGKMPRLAPKFLSKKEEVFVQSHSASTQFDLLHIFWTAKESLYKAYGLKALDFRKHLYVEPFVWDERRGAARGWVKKNAFRQAYKLLFEKIALPEQGEMVWTVCLPERVGESTKSVEGH